MSSEKLRKYLAYYQKVLREEPENIEARLRLAALLKEMGQRSHAIEEYVTASKLLAAQGLPLEAIAACKAVLELDPMHTEVQLFLARLFAQAPDAAGARVARPVELGRAPVAAQATGGAASGAAQRVAPITLERPKPITPAPLAAPPAPRADAPHLASAGEATGVADAPLEELRQTVEMDPAQLRMSDYFEDFRQTQAIHPEEVRRSLQRGVERSNPLLRSPKVIVEDATHAQAPAWATLAQEVQLGTVTSRAPMAEESFEVSVFDHTRVAIDEAQLPDMSMFDEMDSDPSAYDPPTGRLEPARMTIRREELPDIPLFSHLNSDAFVELLRMTRVTHVIEGDVVLAPGASKRSLYIVVRGEVVVSKQLDGEPRVLARMVEGDFFGEFGLLTGRDQSATVLAERDATLLVLDEEALHRAAEHDPDIWDTLWLYYHTRMLNNLMCSNTILGKLDDDEREELADGFELRELADGELLIRHDEPCAFVCLVLFGAVALRPQQVDEPDRLVREGEFFGFLASLSDEPCRADVVATRETSLLCLPARQFRALVRRHHGIAGELRRLLRDRPARGTLFLVGVTQYADAGVV